MTVVKSFIIYVGSTFGFIFLMILSFHRVIVIDFLFIFDVLLSVSKFLTAWYFRCSLRNHGDSIECFDMISLIINICLLDRLSISVGIEFVEHGLLSIFGSYYECSFPILALVSVSFLLR